MKRIRILLQVFIAVALVSCGNAPDLDSLLKRTGLMISLEDTELVQTRSTPAQIGKPASGLFNITIMKNYGTSTETVFDGAYSSELIPVSAGSYSLYATCGENAELAFDSPFYSGSAQAQVTEGAATSVSIPCSVGNCLLSVVFTNPEVFADQFSSYGVLVGLGGKSLDITSANVSQSAYFREGSSISLTFHGVLSGGGKEVSMQISDPALPQTYSAGTHTILSLSASLSSSGTVLTVEKVEVRNVTVEAAIPMEWLPKPVVEGFSGKPSIDHHETAPAPEDAKLGFSAYSPIQEIEFTLDLKDSEYASLNGTYLLSSISEQTKASLVEAGIVLPSLDGTLKSSFIDFGQLAAKLKTNDGEGVSNRIAVRVKANNRWSGDEAEDFIIRVIKPEFSVSVLPGDVWSKEFAADGITVSAGDATLISTDLVYQYSSDGGTGWQVFNNSEKHVFESVPDGKHYKVRACYRGCIYSDNVADVTLETPAQLPNSDMESWQASKVGGGNIFLWKSYYDFLPYSSGESDIWWATNNERSRDYSVSPVDVTTSPCVSYSESIRHGGNRSALMYTSGHGGGYASTITIVYPEGAFAGSLFIGSYKWNDASETVSTGHSFSSRPTAFSFWYKYVPKNSDQFKAYIELRNGADVIASGSFVPQAYSSEDSDFVQAKVNLVYTDEHRIATSVYVRFLSTTKTSFSKSDFNVGESITFPVMGDWKAHIGSKLYIDDLNLEYSR